MEKLRIRELAGKKNLTKLAFIAVGGALGYAYYHFIGCASGTCPITGNPYASTLYGGLVGFALWMIKED